MQDCVILNVLTMEIIQSCTKPLSHRYDNKANLRDLIAATGLVFLLKIAFKSSIFQPVWPENLMDDLEKQLGTSSMLLQALCIISRPSVNWNWSYRTSGNAQFRSKSAIFVPCEVNLMDGLEKPIGHLFYVTSSFVHHFKAIGEFKLELQFGNAQFKSKLTIFCPAWPGNLTDNLGKW